MDDMDKIFKVMMYILLIFILFIIIGIGIPSAVIEWKKAMSYTEPTKPVELYDKRNK